MSATDKPVDVLHALRNALELVHQIRKHGEMYELDGRVDTLAAETELQLLAGFQYAVEARNNAARDADPATAWEAPASSHLQVIAANLVAINSTLGAMLGDGIKVKP